MYVECWSCFFSPSPNLAETIFSVKRNMDHGFYDLTITSVAFVLLVHGACIVPYKFIPKASYGDSKPTKILKHGHR